MDRENYWLTSGRLSRRRVLRGAGVISAGIGGAALIGCSDDDGDGDGTGTPGAGTSTPGASTPGASTGTATASATGAAGEPRPGGSMTTTGSIPGESFNQVVNFWDANYGTGINIYDRLLSSRLGSPGYVLEAAESVELVDDVTVVFKLKEGMVYQDLPPVNGRPVVGEDIVVMQNYTRDEPNAQDNSFQNNSMDTVEAPDDNTVIFHLQQPNAYLFSGAGLGHPATMCIVPSELVLGDFNTTPPVGSGPYRMKDYQFGVRYDYERSETYRDADKGLPYIQERTFLPMTDQAAIDAAFRSEQITRIFSPNAELADRWQQDLGDQLIVEEFTSLGQMTRNISNQREYGQDIRVREAWYRWVDPKQYIDLVVDGWGLENPGYLALGLADYQLDPAETEEAKAYDPEKARQLLDAAGFDFNATYTLTTAAGGGGGANDLALQVLAEQCRAVGITNTSFNALPIAEWLPQVSSTGDYDFCIVTFGSLDTPFLPLRHHHSQPNTANSKMGIADPEIDALIEESERLVDREANIEKVKEVQRALLAKYAHQTTVWTNVGREFLWGYVRDWESNIAWPAHTHYQVQAWIDL